MSLQNTALPESATRWLSEALALPAHATPFPWQRDLLARLLQASLVRSLDIPTGLGKTSVMAIWLIALACGAKLPRRLVYVVDRRAVVDQATEVAMALRALVERTPDLRKALGLGARPLPISTLRGQYVDNREWLEDPASPAIIIGTTYMVGSRLLFEGYGVTRKMRPYHAGLLGSDTLVVLDEAHLVPPFEKLLETIANGRSELGPRDEELSALVPPFALLSLSATARGGSQSAFGLGPLDFDHPVVRQRLNAPKLLTMHAIDDPSTLADALAAHAWAMSGEGTRPVRCIVFCDSRKVASDAQQRLKERAGGDRRAGRPPVDIETELLVGGRRAFEREQSARRLKAFGLLAGSEVERKVPTFLFATSAGEVGVDLDADHMVSDLVAWERMVQRLGRVNRRGNGQASIVVLKSESKPAKSLQGALAKAPGDRSESEARAVAAYERSVGRILAVEKLLQLLPSKNGAIDVSPGTLQRLKREAETDPERRALLDAATSPAPLRPALSRALLDAWAMTSLEKHAGRPEVEPWLRGWIEEDRPQTTVVWRAHMPVRTQGRMATEQEIESFFEAAPPHATELLETETNQVMEWLAARAKVLLPSSSAPTASRRDESWRDDDVVAFVVSHAGDLLKTLKLRDLAWDSNAQSRKKKDEELLAGATLIVRRGVAGLRDGLLEATENAPPPTLDDGGPWVDAPQDGEPETRVPTVRFQVRTLEAAPSSAPEAPWQERFRFATDLPEDGEPRNVLIVTKWRYDAATEEDRSQGRPQLLDVHHAWTADRARDLARRLALPEPYCTMLAIAARLHDEGKRAWRWQHAFNTPPGSGAHAKTSGPVNFALLDGYRHELGSLPFAERDEELRALPEPLRDLALHLIAAHHGFARPLIATDGCDDAPPSALEERARAVALRFARLQRTWGPWGLAWWEALLRAADQQASRDNDEKGRT